MRIAAFFLLLLALPAPSWAGTKTIEASASVAMGDTLSVQQAQRLCQAEARRKALEQAGVWLESKTEVKDMALARDEISLFSAAFVPVKVTASGVDRSAMSVSCSVEATVDPEEVRAQIVEARSNKAVMKTIEALRHEVKDMDRQVWDIYNHLRYGANLPNWYKLVPMDSPPNFSE